MGRLKKQTPVTKDPKAQTHIHTSSEIRSQHGRELSVAYDIYIILWLFYYLV